MTELMQSGGVWGGLLSLGIAAALSPCPLATNIAAVGYISKEMGNQKRALVSALLYTLGRILAYILMGIIVGQGLSSAPIVSYWLQESLPLYLGPLMMIVGLVILEYIPFFSWGRKPQQSTAQYLIVRGGLFGSLVLGGLFALALCPPSAALFFGTALPISFQLNAEFVWLGIGCFGLGTALPVVLFALVFVFSVEKARWLINRLPKFQAYMKWGTGWLFILLGGYWVFTKILFA